MERPEWLPTWACEPPEQRVLAAKSQGRIVERFDLKQAGYFLLGRNSEVCDVPLRHSSSSRTHAAVFFDSEGRAYLRDLSSTHGTFLNGERIDRGSQAELGHRDVFSLGTDPIEYRVEAEQDGRGLEEGSGGQAEGYAGEEEGGRGRHRAYDAVVGRDGEQEWEQRRGRGSPQDHGSPGWRERRVEGAEWQERRSKRARTGEDGRRYRDREASPNDGERPSSRDRWEEQADRARGRYGERDRARPRGDYEAERSSRRDHGGRDYRERDHRRDDHDGYHHERWHSKLYTVMCKFYNTPQGCRNGDRCRFKHVREGGSRHRRRDGSPDSYDHSDDERRRRRRRHSSPENSPPPKPASGGSCFKDMIPRFERSGPNPMMAAAAASGAAPPNATAAPAAGGAAALPPVVPGPTAVAGAPAAPGASSLDIVKKMMAVPGQSGLSLDEKKKLLWGRKDAPSASAAAAAPGSAEPTSAAEPGPGAPASGSSSYGANRWDAAEFDTQEERQRFHKLMGVRQQSSGHAGDAGEDDEDCERVALNRANQEKVLSNLEQQFVAGKRRADGRTLGMGL